MDLKRSVDASVHSQLYLLGWGGKVQVPAFWSENQTSSSVIPMDSHIDSSP